MIQSNSERKQIKNMKNMQILIAPDSYKGSLSSTQVANAMEKGLVRVFEGASIHKIPIADGGEGTVEAMVCATGGRVFQSWVRGPDGAAVQSVWGVLGDGQTAVIEMAAASGLSLVLETKRNPRVTSSFGVGQLIRVAMDRGYMKIILGLGGSATNDGGAGMAEALGFRFMNKAGESLPPGGAALKNLHRIDLSQVDPRLKMTQITVACDVDNPLYGPNGASVIYGPQKGATPEMISELDSALMNFAKIAFATTGRDVANIPGAGAAGGMGAGLLFFTDAVLKPGVQVVLEATGMENLVREADLIVTGEGRTDSQTSFGKAPSGVGELAKKYDKVAICLSGSLGEGAENILRNGIHAIASIAPGPISLEDCLSQAEKLIEKAAFRSGLMLRAGMTLSIGANKQQIR